MKSYLPILFFIFIFVSSCSHRFHVYDIQSNQVDVPNGDLFLFENDDLALVYDFWTEGGHMLFNVYNKRDSTLFLKMDKSVFNINGRSTHYYNDRPDIFDDGLNRLSKQKIIVIAALDNASVEGFPISLAPLKPKSDDTFFYKKDSPMVFTNELVYAFNALDEEDLSCQNEFWVSNVQRMKRKDFVAFDENLNHSKSDKFFIFRPGVSTEFWLQLAVETLNASFLLF